MRFDTFAAVEAAAAEAEEHAARGDFPAALNLYTEVVSERVLARGDGLTAEAAHGAADLAIIERLVDYAILFSSADACEKLLEALALLSERAGNSHAADYYRLKQAGLAIERGCSAHSYETLAEMCERVGGIETIEFSMAGLERLEARWTWPGANSQESSFLFSVFYYVLGRVWSSLGSYGDALAALARGRLYAAHSPDDPYQVALHLRTGEAAVLLETGNFGELRQLLSTLLPFVNVLRAPGLFIRLLEISAKLHLFEGDFGRALDAFRRVLKTCDRYGFDHASLSAALNLTHILILLNKTGPARELLEVARVRAESLCDEAVTSRVFLLWQLAAERGRSPLQNVPPARTTTELWAGGRVEAAPEGDGGGHVFMRSHHDNHLTLFEERAAEFHWMLGAVRVGEAGSLLSDMRETFAQTDSELILVRLRVLDAIHAYYAGDLVRAEAKFAALLPPLKSLGLKHEQWQLQRFLGWCWLKLGRPEGERARLSEETQALLNSITASLRQDDRAIFLLNKWTAEEDYFAGEIERLSEIRAELLDVRWFRRPFVRLRLWKRLHKLLHEIDCYKDALARRVVGASADGVAEAAAAPPSLYSRLWRHPRDRATLSFLVLPDRVFIARASWISMDFSLSAMTRLEVREQVRRWHERVRWITAARRRTGARDLSTLAEWGGADAGAELRRLSDRLAEDMQLPHILKGLRRHVKALTIVPDDCLHGFPFAALTCDGKYLIERFALTFAFESAAGTHARPPAAVGALTVGVSKGSRHYSPLPAVPKELEQVRAWLKRRGIPERRFSDSDRRGVGVGKQGVLDALPGASFAHIACHGTFKPDRPDCSGLVLNSEQDRPAIISLRELSALDLRGLRHITLSSCWSADHFILPGRWVISLPETLFRVGAESILGCLWLIDDSVGAAFMGRFYQHLEKLPRREALRQAQIDALGNGLDYQEDERPARAGRRKAETSDPIYWAGFHLYGDGGPLRL